jgi:hypothetical protein
VGASLYDLTLLNDQYLIRLGDGAETVSNHEAGATF